MNLPMKTSEACLHDFFVFFGQNSGLIGEGHGFQNRSGGFVVMVDPKMAAENAKLNEQPQVFASNVAAHAFPSWNPERGTA